MIMLPNILDKSSWEIRTHLLTLKPTMTRNSGLNKAMPVHSICIPIRREPKALPDSGEKRFIKLSLLVSSLLSDHSNIADCIKGEPVGSPFVYKIIFIRSFLFSFIYMTIFYYIIFTDILYIYKIFFNKRN